MVRLRGDGEVMKDLLIASVMCGSESWSEGEKRREGGVVVT